MAVSKRGGGGGSKRRSLALRLRSISPYRSLSVDGAGAERFIARFASSILK